MWWLNPLIQLGGGLCLSIILLVVVVGGFRAYSNSSSERFYQAMGAALVIGGCIVSFAAIFAFIGFILDVILATKEMFSLAGAGAGMLVGIWLGVLLSARSSL